MRTILLLLMILIPCVAKADITSNLTAWWPLTALTGTSTPDISGNGNTGTTSGSPTLTGGKVYTNAIQLNGSNQYVDVGGTSTLNFSGSMTVAAWVYLTDNSDNGIILASTNFINLHAKFQMFIGSSGVGGTQFSSTCNVSNQEGISSGTAFPINSWHHVVYVADITNTIQKAYLDGVEVATGSWTGGTCTSTIGSYQIGARHLSNSSTDVLLPGNIQDVRFYSRALTASDVQELYNYRHPTSTIQANGVDPVTSGIVAEWKFNEGSGSTAADSSGNGHTGTLNNSPSWVTGITSPYAISFNGSNQNMSATNFNCGNYRTHSFWIYVSSYPGSQKAILGKRDQQDEESIYLQSSGLVTWTAYNQAQSNVISISSVSAVPLNTWTYVTLTNNASNAYIYINGTQDASGSSGAIGYQSGQPIYIASEGASRYLTGYIDDYRIYNRNLSALEIQTIYNNGNGSPSVKASIN